MNIKEEYDKVRADLSPEQKADFDKQAKDWLGLMASRYQDAITKDTPLTYIGLFDTSIKDWLDWMRSDGNGLVVDFLITREDILDELSTNDQPVVDTYSERYSMEDGTFSLHRSKRGWSLMAKTLRMHDWFMRRNSAALKSNCKMWAGDNSWGEDFFSYLEETGYLKEV